MAIPVNEVLNHWAHSFENFSISAQDFYAALQKRVSEQQMPKTEINVVTHKESGLFSASREYVRVKHADLVFDICAAPFGKNFFISWWLYETQGAMRSLFGKSAIGNILQARAAKRTFFQMDAEQMFKDCVHTCILDTVKEKTEGKGVRELTEKERQYKQGGL